MKRNTNGSVSIITEEDINLSGTSLINNVYSSLNFICKLKISTPCGLALNFERPLNQSFVNVIYPEFSMNSNNNNDENIIFNHYKY